MKHVYILFKYYNNKERNEEGIFTSFDKAKAAGNAYISWTGHQAKPTWTKIDEYNWHTYTSNFIMTIYKIKLDHKWWSKK